MTYDLEFMCKYSDSNISQGSVAKRLRCGGIFTDLSAKCSDEIILKIGLM